MPKDKLINTLRDIGSLDMEVVRAKSVRQTERVVAAADARGWQVNSPRDPARRGGHVSVFPPGAEQIAQGMVEERIMVDYRPRAGIRVAPHFYTTDEEVDRALDAMDRLSAR